MSISIQPFLAFVIGALLVYFTIPIIVRVSKAKKLYDFPDERKVNKKVIPNLGGVSLFIGICIATLICLNNLLFRDFRYILVGMIILLFVGIKDDIMIISARKKFIAQLICSFILIIFGDIRFTNLHGVLGVFEINYVTSFGISMLAIVAIINALNLIDGIDGLASGIGILTSLIFGIIFFNMEQITYAILCLAVTGSLIVFFFFNVYGNANKIFMGDTGSLILGLIIAALVIKFNELTITSSEVVRNFAPALSMAIISIPLFDMIRVFAIRIMQKKSPLYPDMNHIHHKLLRFGFSHNLSTIILLAVNLFLIGVALLTISFEINIQLLILISVSTFLFFVPDILFIHIQKNRASQQRQFSSLLYETFHDQSKQKGTRQDYSIKNGNAIKKSKEKEPEEAVV